MLIDCKSSAFVMYIFLLICNACFFIFIIKGVYPITYCLCLSPIIAGCELSQCYNIVDTNHCHNIYKCVCWCVPIQFLKAHKTQFL
jgi:hypothetical protein